MKLSFNFPIQFSCLLIFIFLFSGCDLLEDDEKSGCDATKADAFVLGVIPNVNIIYANGDDYGNYNVKFDIYKSYCDGTLSGTFSTEDMTSPQGRASFPMQYEYKFANTEDKVYFTYTIIQGGKNIKHAQNGFTTTSDGRLLHTVKGEITYGFANNMLVSFNGNKVAEMDIDWFERTPIELPWNLEDVHFDDFAVP